ncbi:unnamed protein product [Miscanthus lutarioriparius]|uniref:Uncharacterized protein n=1 Tax=Miscanthus lutarioriparius TaxID=422564 RepID=A0A811MJU1_9POAL|nr:unnamed protein product [Miscanthus lutarioriparius]
MAIGGFVASAGSRLVHCLTTHETEQDTGADEQEYVHHACQLPARWPVAEAARAACRLACANVNATPVSSQRLASCGH